MRRKREMHKLYRYLVIGCILLMTLVICSCVTPVPTPSAPDFESNQKSTTVQPFEPAIQPETTQVPVINLEKFTIKYYNLKEDLDGLRAAKFWAFSQDRSLLIYFKTPATPFTVQKLLLAGWIIGNDKRNWQSREFKLGIWDTFGDNILWTETYPYSDFDPNTPKWVEYQVPNIQVGDTFTIEFTSNSELSTVGFGTAEKLRFKCGMALGVDYSGQYANSDVQMKGTTMPKARGLKPLNNLSSN